MWRLVTVKEKAPRAALSFKRVSLLRSKIITIVDEVLSSSALRMAESSTRMAMLRKLGLSSLRSLSFSSGRQTVITPNPPVRSIVGFRWCICDKKSYSRNLQTIMEICSACADDAKYIVRGPKYRSTLTWEVWHIYSIEMSPAWLGNVS